MPSGLCFSCHTFNLIFQCTRYWKGWNMRRDYLYSICRSMCKNHYNCHLWTKYDSFFTFRVPKCYNNISFNYIFLFSIIFDRFIAAPIFGFAINSSYYIQSRRHLMLTSIVITLFYQNNWKCWLDLTFNCE
jgi:hypothetical protein